MRKRIATGILTVILAVFMWSAFPGYVFHTWFWSDTASNHSVVTEVLADSVLTTQYFAPILPFIRSIQFAVEFEEEVDEGETVLFSLCDEDENVIFSQEIPISDMESNTYYDVEINQRLKTGRNYYWSLTSPMSAAYDWKMMYTELPGDQAVENQLFLIGNDTYGSGDAQTISQYVYYDHHDKVVIIGGFWSGGILVYLICLEVINRILKKSDN